MRRELGQFTPEEVEKIHDEAAWSVAVIATFFIVIGVAIGSADPKEEIARESNTPTLMPTTERIVETPQTQ